MSTSPWPAPVRIPAITAVRSSQRRAAVPAMRITRPIPAAAPACSTAEISVERPLPGPPTTSRCPSAAGVQTARS